MDLNSDCFASHYIMSSTTLVWLQQFETLPLSLPFSGWQISKFIALCVLPVCVYECAVLTVDKPTKDDVTLSNNRGMS